MITRIAVMDVVYSFIGYSIDEIKLAMRLDRLNIIDANTALKYSKRRVILNTLATRHV